MPTQTSGWVLMRNKERAKGTPGRATSHTHNNARSPAELAMHPPDRFYWSAVEAWCPTSVGLVVSVHVGFVPGSTTSLPRRFGGLVRRENAPTCLRPDATPQNEIESTQCPTCTPHPPAHRHRWYRPSTFLHVPFLLALAAVRARSCEFSCVEFDAEKVFPRAVLFGVMG